MKNKKAKRKGKSINWAKAFREMKVKAAFAQALALCVWLNMSFAHYALAGDSNAGNTSNGIGQASLVQAIQNAILIARGGGGGGGHGGGGGGGRGGGGGGRGGGNGGGGHPPGGGGNGGGGHPPGGGGNGGGGHPPGGGGNGGGGHPPGGGGNGGGGHPPGGGGNGGGGHPPGGGGKPPGGGGKPGDPGKGGGKGGDGGKGGGKGGDGGNGGKPGRNGGHQPTSGRGGHNGGAVHGKQNHPPNDCPPQGAGRHPEPARYDHGCYPHEHYPWGCYCDCQWPPYWWYTYNFPSILVDVDCPPWWLEAGVGPPYPTPQPPNTGDAQNPPTYGAVYFFYDSDVAYDQGLDEVQKVQAEDEYSYWVHFYFIDMRDADNQATYGPKLMDPNARPAYLICPTSGEESLTPVMDANGNRLGDIEGEVLDSEHLRNDIKWLLFPPQTDENGKSVSKN